MLLLLVSCTPNVALDATPARTTAPESVESQAFTKDTGPCAGPLRFVFDPLPTTAVACGESVPRAMRFLIANESACGVVVSTIPFFIDVVWGDPSLTFTSADLALASGSAYGSTEAVTGDGSVVFTGVTSLAPHDVVFMDLTLELTPTCGGTPPEQFSPILLAEDVVATRSDATGVTWIAPIPELEGYPTTVE